MVALRLTLAARTDLRAIHAESENLFGLTQADRYAEGLTKALRLLTEFPRAGRLRTDTKIPVRTRPYKSHVILYDFDGVEVVVLRVRHAGEDWINDPEGSSSEDHP